jgi:hypothetical protein
MSEHDPIAAIKRLLSRRRLLSAGIGVAALGGVGAAWLGTRDPHEYLKALIRISLPGTRLDEASLHSFAHDNLLRFYRRIPANHPAERLASSLKLHAAEGARELLGIEAVARLGPLREATARIKRRALTRFLMNSNFFSVADRSVEAVVYDPPTSEACRNIFADLAPPKATDVTPWR